MKRTILSSVIVIILTGSAWADSSQGAGAARMPMADDTGQRVYTQPVTKFESMPHSAAVVLSEGVAQRLDRNSEFQPTDFASFWFNAFNGGDLRAPLGAGLGSGD